MLNFINQLTSQYKDINNNRQEGGSSLKRIEF